MAECGVTDRDAGATPSLRVPTANTRVTPNTALMLGFGQIEIEYVSPNPLFLDQSFGGFPHHHSRVIT